MGLINRYTDLKSLKFGKDRIGGGNSQQPYIQTPIPNKIGEFGFLNQDFILRGGSKAVTDSVLDVERLSKYFTDLRNPSGLLFIAKQNLLSRTAVRTQASTGLLNEGTYTPLSTLAEAGGVAFGLHVNKQGLNPFGGNGGITKYSDVIKLTNTSFTTSTTTTTTTSVGTDYISGAGASNIVTSLPTLETNSTTVINLRNRLIGLWNDDIITKNDSINILSYGGGPGSILGIGNTNIKFATGNGSNDVRTGVNNSELQLSGFLPKFQNPNTVASPRDYNYGVFKNHPQNVPGINIDGRNLLGVSNEYLNLLVSDPKNDINGITPSGKIDSTIRRVGQLDTVDLNIKNENQNSTVTYTQEQLINIPEDPSNDGTSNYIGRKGNTTPGDFRKLLRNKLEGNTEIGNLINAPDYTKKNIEQRVLLGDPGNRNGKNLTSYTNGSYGGAASNNGNGSYDKLNASYIYQSENPNFDMENKDLVKFAITVIDNDDQTKNTNIHFRAFLNQISDGYTAEWNPTKYIGRGENFYTYGGFDRKVSLSWTVAAQSKIELIPMYKKLNYLASICTPDYSKNGYMRGNLVKLTIGGYFYEQPGIINGLSYEMNDDNSTWEIGIDDVGLTDETVKELPHVIKVSNFSFTPIHTFVPRKQNLVFDNEHNAYGYGPERYIALKDSVNNNYGDPVPWDTNPAKISLSPNIIRSTPPPSTYTTTTKAKTSLLAAPTFGITATP